MKTKDPKLTHLIVLIMSLLMIFAGCSTDPAPGEPDPEPNPVDIDANKIAESLRFRNSTVIPGTVPATVKTADLKIDTDTIFWVEGIKNRIKILKPVGLHISSKSFRAQVTDADSYIEAEFEIEDETDTIVFLIFDFDLAGLQPPFSFHIRIVPLDDNGVPIDEFDLTVTIEALTDGDCNFPYEAIWEWIYSVGSNDFFSAPMYAHLQPGTVIGCCSDTGDSYYEPSCANPANNFRRELNYENVFMVRLEYLKFFKSGDVLGEFDQFTRNILPSLSDFCSGTPGYTERNVHNSMYGTFTFDQGNCSLIIDQLEGETDGGFPLPFYAGAGEYKMISRHFLRERRSGEGTLDRIYERRTKFFTWFD